MFKYYTNLPLPGWLSSASARLQRRVRGMGSMKKAPKAVPAGNLEKIRQLPVQNMNKNSECLKLIFFHFKDTTSQNSK